jgi:LmbE family N-acetylglucosaminyl deacetylase
VNIVLVVAPHPDDETLGCGGTILRHKADGDEMHWLIMTAMFENEGYSTEKIKSRLREINNVAKQYGFAKIHQAGYPTATLDRIPKKNLVSSISKVLNEVKPNTIYIPFFGDVHSDHREVFNAVASCTKSFRFPFIRQVRAYEILSETECNIIPGVSFQPNLWVEISDNINEQIAIMRHYESELGEHPFPRSEKCIRALANLRGSTIGVEAAEAFMSLKEVV